MESTENGSISCRVTQMYSVKPEDNNFPWYVFSLDISTTFINYSARETFLVDRHMLLDEKTSRSSLHDLLLEMNVPVHEDDGGVLIDPILDCARRMVSSEGLKSRKILRLRVEIHVGSSLDFDEDGAVLNVMPASESSIDALEKVSVVDHGGDVEMQDCVICLQQLLIGSEATRLPCSHLYHHMCIRIWLKSNGVCPLCRFRIVN